MNKKKTDVRSVVMYVIGMILCPLGVAFATKAGFGVSMIEAPVYVSYLHFRKMFSFLTFGTCEYILQALVIILLSILIRKFRIKYLFSFVTAVVYGFILDSWLKLLGDGIYDRLSTRIISCSASIILIAFAVACFLRTSLPQEAWELFVKELAENYKFNMTKVKWIYDFASLTVGIVLMLIFFRRFNTEAIGIGTVITTFINAPIIGLFGKLIDKVWKTNKTADTD